MKPEESKYASYELEILAIIKTLRKLRVYLLRIPFKIDTDCRTFALTMKEKNMHASSALDIGPRKNRIRKHQSGKSIVLVNALTRNPISFRSRNRILNATAASNTEDIDIRWIYKLSETEKDNEYIIHGGVLFKKVNDIRMVITKKMQRWISKKCHEISLWARPRCSWKKNIGFQVMIKDGKVIRNRVECSS